MNHDISFLKKLLFLVVLIFFASRAFLVVASRAILLVRRKGFSLWWLSVA